MTVMRGFIRKATARYGDTRLTPMTHQYTIDTFVGEEGRFLAGQPVTLTSEYHQCEPAAKPEEPLTAAGLSAAHIGSRVRVEVLGGAVVEDKLTAVFVGGSPARISLTFEYVKACAALYGPPDFGVLPDTPVTIVKEPTK